MKVKKIPQRTCIGCGEIHNKKEMAVSYTHLTLPTT